MKDLFHQITLSQHTTLQEAILHLEKNDLDGTNRVVLYVIDEDQKLLGSIMDVDIRRSALQNHLSPQTPITQIMNPAPRKIIEGQEVDLQTYQTWKRFPFIPIVNQDNKLLRFKANHEIYNYPNKVIIMAGGLGTRLRPLTNETPKPMLKIGAKPILQEIIEGFQNKGFSSFFISVNYKAEVIKEYFKDGKKFGVKINYLEEEKQLGTCGSIKFAESYLTEPFFVINGDILADIDYKQLLTTHTTSQNDITVCIFPYSYTVPFGVIEDHLKTPITIKEKPTYTHYINCGVYIISPSTLDLINQNEHLDMPTLITKAISKNLKVGTFIINEWIDIGNLEDFYRARDKINLNKE
ncbi:nucleotidyltransferase family protein [Helicobacter kayseriensis]|uniref:nucleotidyltransferase family protein n=1 Tax=Helicobacter kayseriensis TaxID=2905877 RepID=UPI001E304398|nr:nucleotidyltransferase family protein [Helicobacter kayseriensis]MCE3046663.1 nucleotidyltransferase family protein [Helicobacter kayseriensis]MCE3048035.1 nucleotidyltransferase family protein [Helicobacter kayseriensis]